MAATGFTQAQAQSANRRVRTALEAFAKVDLRALEKSIEEYRRKIGEQP